MKSLVQCLKQLKEDGYNKNLSIKNELLYTSDKIFLPTPQLTIDQTYRIEEDSDPTHQSIVYAISCKAPDVKGVLVNSYGPYSESDKDNLINQISSAI
ncbi:MAG: hypothetical protein CL677_06540 [Bdellovibrionaceae bacterium]|nr:hypothetical protein [Pseudobdellovibrionaceae bacterium]|tara:strand:+ start:43356 stop:43649 length:294 start_codon:yes stop_codon:yes gene_type:complete